MPPHPEAAPSKNRIGSTACLVPNIFLELGSVAAKTSKASRTFLWLSGPHWERDGDGSGIEVEYGERIQRVAISS